MSTTTTLRDWSKYDYMSAIIKYEQGNLSAEKTVVLFQYLVDTGMAWTLQGHYGRMAKALIDSGSVSLSPSESPENFVESEPEASMESEPEVPVCPRCGEPIPEEEQMTLIDEDARESYNRGNPSYRGAVDWPTIVVHKGCATAVEYDHYAL